jgi:hypothetical protein
VRSPGGDFISRWLPAAAVAAVGRRSNSFWEMPWFKRLSMSPELWEWKLGEECAMSWGSHRV